MKACLLTVLVVLSVTASFDRTPQVEQEVRWGMVEGVVVDGDGKPLSGATVTSSMDAKGAIRDVTQYQTNAQGEFSFRLPAGHVWLSAHKDSEGYPYAFFAFYIMPGQEFPTIEVKAGETIKGVVIRVGVRAAHLDYEVMDEDGKLVLGGFEFMRLDQDTPYTTSALAKDDLLVPPVPFRVTFEAKGYKAWHYGGEKWRRREGVVALKSGEVLHLAIRLQRAR